MSRKIIVEINQSVDYLGSVLREIRWKVQEEEGSKDIFLQRIYEQRSSAFPYKYVKGSRGSWSFRYDVVSCRHHKGTIYTFYNSGTLEKKSGKKDEFGDFEIFSIETPNIDKINPEVLFNSIRELEIVEIISS
jgi:hypothetical protein